MNNITFQGINNISIGKNAFSQTGSYMSSNGHVRQGIKDNLYVKIKCDLSDDVFGNHLTKFKEALNKCGNFYKENCINQSSPDQFELILRHYDVKNDKNAEFNSLKLNGCEVLLNNRKTLPLYSFMAQITKEIAKHPTTTDTRKSYIDMVNSKIYKIAMDFIDNLM